MDTDSPIKVRLMPDRDSWHGYDTEGIWTRLVQPLADKVIVEVDNIPFFTRILSLHDKISAIYVENELIFDTVVERGGHSTYRLFVESSDEAEPRTLTTLKVMGCDCETARFNGGILYALDVPPDVDIYKVYAILEEGQKG